MVDKDYGLIQDHLEFREHADRIIASGKPFAFDIESGYTGDKASGLATMYFHPRWVMAGFSFSDDPNWARYVAVNHDDQVNAHEVETAAILWELLQTGMGVPHHAHFELMGLARWFRDVLSDHPVHGEAVRISQGLYPFFSDTMFEVQLLQAYPPLANGRGVGNGLKNLVKHIFGHEMVNLKDLFPDLKAAGNSKQLRFNILELNKDAVEYACEDSAWTLSLHQMHYPQVRDMTMFQAELKLLPILCKMELEGMALNWEEYERQEKIISQLKAEMNEEIQNELSEQLGELVSVNFNSPKQVAELLYDRMGLPEQFDRKTGRRTTGEAALERLVRETDNHTLKRILEWRTVSKLLSSYITKYLQELRYDPEDRGRPSHNQMGAGTGRFSVDGVSYQQWPKSYHFELKSGKVFDLNYRNFLKSPDDYRIIGFDYSQVELRVIAGMAQETDMIRAFNEGTDIHKLTASRLLKVPMDEVDYKTRQKGKGLNFALVYGQGADALADTLGVSEEEAEELLEQYFEAFPKLRGWIEARQAEAAESFEVYTKFGRRFHVWEMDNFLEFHELSQKSKDPATRKKYTAMSRMERSKADRMAVNAPVQGGAADYIKIGMIRADQAIRDAGMEDKIRMVMTIHDAVEFYVHKSVETQYVIDLLTPAFSYPLEGFPEILSEWHEGHLWGNVVEVLLDDDKKIRGYEWEDPEGKTHEFGSLVESEEYIEYYEAHRYDEKPEEDEPEESLYGALHVYLPSNPVEHEWQAFKGFLSEVSGDYPVHVYLGEGSKTMESVIPSLTRDQVQAIQNMLPDAEIQAEEIV